MKTYEVDITETLSKRIEVEAESKSDAIDIIRERYRNEEIILDNGDFVDTEFNATAKYLSVEDIVELMEGE